MEGIGTGGCGRAAAFVVVADVVVVVFWGLGGASAFAVLGAGFDFGGSGRLGGGGGGGSSSVFHKIKYWTVEGRKRADRRRSPRPVGRPGE